MIHRPLSRTLIRALPFVLWVAFPIQLLAWLGASAVSLRGPRSLAEASASSGVAPFRARVGACGELGCPIALPAAWRSVGRAPRDLEVFLDGVPLRFIRGGHALEPPPAAFYLGPRTNVLLLACEAGSACSELVVFRATLGFRMLRGARALLAFPALVIAFGIGALGWATLAAASRRHRARAPWFALIGAAGWGWAWQTPGAERFLAPALLSQALVVASPWIAALAAWICGATRRAWALASSPDRGFRARCARAGFFLAASLLAGAPHAVVMSFWYPSRQDDALTLLFGASRLVANGPVWRALFDRSAWVHPSGVPALLALIWAGTGVHPMLAFKVLGYLGGSILAGSAGLFVWLASRRLSLGLLGVAVAGTWGGLAGYAWLLQSALPALLAGRSAPLLETDYFEPGYFGEYAGPSSELISYLCAPPLYHRELALAAIWPALGLLVSPASAGPLARAAVFPLLMLGSALYPYYSLPCALLIGFATIRLGRMSRHPWIFVLAGAGGLLALVVLAEFVLRFARGQDLFDLARGIAQRSDLRLVPARGFNLPRLLSAHAFMLIAWGLALWRSSPPERRAVLGWNGRWPFLLGLAVSACLGILNDRPGWGAFYSWLNVWRPLVAPVLVLAAALAIARILEGRRGFGLAKALLLLTLPCLSVLHWSVNAALFLSRARLEPAPVGEAGLFDEFAGHGSELLGRLALRGPLLVEGRALVSGDMAQAAFGVVAVESRAIHGIPDGPGTWSRKLEPAAWPELVVDMQRGRVGDLLARRGGALEAFLLRSKACERIGSVGPFDVLRAIHGRAATKRS